LDEKNNRRTEAKIAAIIEKASQSILPSQINQLEIKEKRNE
jgi:hypothetical protein